MHDKFVIKQIGVDSKQPVTKETIKDGLNKAQKKKEENKSVKPNKTPQEKAENIKNLFDIADRFNVFQQKQVEKIVLENEDYHKLYVEG